jgi:hypothetical protein
MPSVSASPLPDLIVIGAMKCGTTAVHRYLDRHPDIAMARAKEVNFFNGAQQPAQHPPEQSADWRSGRWHRGTGWYADQFDPEAPLRGESSPAYTSPSFPEVPARMAKVVPDVRLVCLVRDPVDRAVSQYAHHRHDGAERRPLADAVLDPDSQYLERSRYAERLAPYLVHFPAEQVHVVVQERLAADPVPTITDLLEHVGADPGWRDDAWEHRVHRGAPPAYDDAFRARVLDAVEDDVAALRELLDDPLAEWDR